MNYSQTLAVLLGWIGRPVRATVYDARGNAVLALNGELGRAPDSSENESEVRFFCIGHDNARDGADGFFIPAETFKHSMYPGGGWAGRDGAVLFIALDGSSLVIERDPVLGRSSV